MPNMCSQKYTECLQDLFLFRHIIVEETNESVELFVLNLESKFAVDAVDISVKR